MKKILLISLLLLVVFSCKDDESEIVSPDREYSPKIIQETYGNAKLVGFVNDKNGSPLADATVFFGAEKTTTGSDGSYQLNTLSAGTNKRIWFEKDGYASTQKLANISEELPNRIDASLFPIGKTEKMSSDGGTIEAENFSVEIEQGGFVYSDGSAVEEDVIVEATAFLATDDELLNAFPGEFRGTRTDGTTTAIESFGFIDVELKVESGEPVQMAEGVMATINIKAPENAPPTIPMWHYDEDKAKWIEEGVGTLNEGFYTADVNHFTKWNWDRPYDETSKLVGRVIDSDGNPIEGATVVQKGITYRFQNSSKTDENGEFELLTLESNESEIEAYFDIYGSTVVNYTTSPTTGQTNDVGDIKIHINSENIISPYISSDVLYITMEQKAMIRGKYFGNEKRTDYKLLLNGTEVATRGWENELIEFDVPIGIPAEGTIQIERDGMFSREVDYEEGDWFCEIAGVVYDNNYLPKDNDRYELYISRSSLDRIPDCIGNLQNLNILSLNSNELVTLPLTVANLHNLNKLEINYNELTSLPNNIGNLKKLKELHLIRNKINTLPSSIGNLLKIDTINLQENQISKLPESIGNLNTLHTFNLEQNDLTTLPESLGNLPNLQSLTLKENQISSLPESFGDLHNLKFLNLSSNQLISLPKSFGKLQSLITFYIYGNSLTTLPENFGNLSNLKEFVAISNEITSLPTSIGQLQNIEYLRLDSNKLTALPESIGGLPILRGLDIEYNQLSTLPESFGNLPNLVALSLEGNQMSSLPESFGDLENLKWLNLVGTRITVLPESFANLLNLYELRLNDNQLTTLPESIKKLKMNLKFLYLGGNNFSEEERAKIEGWLPNTDIFW